LKASRSKVGTNGRNSEDNERMEKTSESGLLYTDRKNSATFQGSNKAFINLNLSRSLVAFLKKMPYV
jgi:hypothetical protein